MHTTGAYHKLFIMDGSMRYCPYRIKYNKQNFDFVSLPNWLNDFF